MSDDDDAEPDTVEPAGADVERTLLVQTRRRSVLSAVASAQPATLIERVGWILNNYPDTRNSDITLQLRYWETFTDYRSGDPITPDDLYTLPRLISLSRARASIQNTLKLFLADAEVRKHRGTLSDEEREQATAVKSLSAPAYAVYVDESGISQKSLLVGSLWLLQAPDAFPVVRKLLEWQDNSAFKGELHFTDVDERSLPYFKQAIDLLVDNASALSLKYVAMPRAGAGTPSHVIPRMIYHLVAHGIRHEDATGRAPLPRTLQLWKDAVEPSYDRLVLADLRDRLDNAAAAQFGGRLLVDTVEAADSKTSVLLQVVDLFVASLNRFVNPPDPPPTRITPKDQLARHVIDRTGVVIDAEKDDTLDDLAVRINL